MNTYLIYVSLIWRTKISIISSKNRKFQCQKKEYWTLNINYMTIKTRQILNTVNIFTEKKNWNTIGLSKGPKYLLHNTWRIVWRQWNVFINKLVYLENLLNTKCFCLFWFLNTKQTFDKCKTLPQNNRPVKRCQSYIYMAFVCHFTLINLLILNDRHP